MPFVADEFSGRSFGSYEVMCRLAVGGMAEIFLAAARKGPFQGRPVVLKRILQEQREDPASLQMLIDEAKVTATLSHAHVAQVLDLERAGEEVLLVIEFIRGANLEELVETCNQRKEPLPLGLVLAVVRDAAMGLQTRAQPQRRQGRVAADHAPRRHAAKSDARLRRGRQGARLRHRPRQAGSLASHGQAGMVRGTTAYMSPEQAIDGKDVDTRTDHLLAGHHLSRAAHRAAPLLQRQPGAKRWPRCTKAEIPLPSKVNRRVPRALDHGGDARARAHRWTSATRPPLELIRDLSLAAGSTAWSPKSAAPNWCVNALPIVRIRDRQAAVEPQWRRAERRALDGAGAGDVPHDQLGPRAAAGHHWRKRAAHGGRHQAGGAHLDPTRAVVRGRAGAGAAQRWQKRPERHRRVCGADAFLHAPVRAVAPAPLAKARGARSAHRRAPLGLVRSRLDQHRAAQALAAARHRFALAAARTVGGALEHRHHLAHQNRLTRRPDRRCLRRHGARRRRRRVDLPLDRFIGPRRASRWADSPSRPIAPPR